MNNMLKRLAEKLAVYKNLGIYATLPILTKVVSFFLLPLYSHELTPDNYAVIGLLSGVGDFFATIVALEIGVGYSRSYLENDSKEYRQKLTSNTFLFILLFGLPVTVLINFIFIFLSGIESIAILDENIQLLFLLSTSSIFLNVLISMVGVRVRLEEKANAYVFINLLSTIFGMLLSILFVLILKMGLVGFYIALMLGSVISFGLWLKYLGRINFKIDKEKVKEILQMSIPTIPSRLSESLIRYSDKYFVITFVSQYQLGIYQFGANVATNFLMFISVFDGYYYPLFFKKREKEGFKDYNIMVLGYSFIIIVGAFFLSEFFFFVNATYLKSFPFILLLCYYYFLKIIEVTLNYEVHYFKKFGIFGKIGVISLFLNLFFNYVLVIKFAAYGVIVATITVQVINISLLHYFLKRAKLSIIQVDTMVILFSLVFMTFAIFLIQYFPAGIEIINRLSIKGLAFLFIFGSYYLFYKKVLKNEKLINYSSRC